MTKKSNSYKVVVISHRAEDHASLRAILQRSPWEVHGAHTAGDGLRFLRGHDPVPVVICEESLPDGDWRFVLRELEQLPVRPSFIVSARLAHERLWAEALNLGAYDLLLSAPFEAEEVIRVTESAWLSWNQARGQTAVARRSPGFARNRKAATLKVLAAGSAV
jgi:DNA-binding NtrC family response regulator